jgi:hypothetical protein
MKPPRFLNWWEVAGLAPATLLLAPFLAYGTIGLFFAAFGVAVSPSVAGARIFAITMIAAIAAQALLGLASLISLWVVVLGGVARICWPPHRRWTAAVLLAAGEADAAYFLFGKHIFREIRTDGWSVVFWSAALVPPVLLGLRYLILLARSGRTEILK